MTALAIVFGYLPIFKSHRPHMLVFLLCGLVPFNFFAMAWNTGTSSLMDNYSIMKRVTVPRELFPIATVLGNCVHLLIQIGILFAFTLADGFGVNRHWLLLPYVWLMAILFVCGMALTTSAINVYIRDTRYVVESVNTILFYFVPIFYGHNDVPDALQPFVHYNPIAALIQSQRNILMDGVMPPVSLIEKLTGCSVAVFIFGFFLFRRLKAGFFDHM
jgi:ABC-type polysaccharide/polyol phosphate export permease